FKLLSFPHELRLLHLLNGSHARFRFLHYGRRYDAYDGGIQVLENRDVGDTEITYVNGSVHLEVGNVDFNLAGDVLGKARDLQSMHTVLKQSAVADTNGHATNQDHGYLDGELFSSVKSLEIKMDRTVR